MTQVISKDQLATLTRAYRMFFSSAEGMEVLNDLMVVCKFCLPISSKEEEGMRQVFLRILEFSQLSDEELIAFYANRLMIKPMERQDD